MSYLVTGAAGFIGSHLVEALLRRGERVVGVDNFTSYYDPARKRRNLAWALEQPGFTLAEADMTGTVSGRAGRWPIHSVKPSQRRFGRASFARFTVTFARR